ncbi:RUN and SH3 domain-containing protein 1 [Sciurus carolinensis]|uniref:RUN and SH3 domain-containing protein 1 n=2 Tax=Sciurus carolinensis TaxID=30640 RepID=A0AA41SYK3_SCICA|nr:AP-4 complex accessory subunit RUSC1 isoform X1 [Sciurus carolinensis]XP_047408708.1 AP-4 complex accessory subunit RUSC1 isoform X1 [Sciurus carolinensis]MBZ3877216.1 RUN and SH3 domain-containing protein 1 [Sciurus carolinensis]
MLSPQRALLCNLNHIHLQHVSLGLHLSRRPELREGPLSTPPPPGDTGGKESRGPCSGTLVDANSNSPAVPCRCCQEHGPSLENRLDPSQEEEGAASPSDPGCSSSLSSCSDLSPDESPVSVYSRHLPGDEDAHPQPSIIPLEQGSPLASADPGNCSPDSFCCSPDSCSGASSTPGPGLDSNCNALTTCQDLPSSGLEEEEESGEQDLPTSELSEAEDGKIDAGKTEPSWKINPIWKIDTEKTEAGWKITENNNSDWKINGNTNSNWKTEPGKFDPCWNTTTGITDSGSKIDAGKIDGGWRSDVSEEPVPHRTITSFHELAQKRKRGPGLPLIPQAKKDRSDWLIVFSPDTELPPTGSLGSSSAPHREVTTFKELRSRSRAPPPPVPPRDPPAGWALVPPRPPPPPVPPRRKKNRSGLQPIAEGQLEEGRAVSLAAGEEAPTVKEPEEPEAQTGLEAGPLLLPRPLIFRFSADGRPLLEGGGAGAAGSLLLAPLAEWPGTGLRLLGAPSPPEEQLLPVRLSPVGAYSPPTRGTLPCLASPELALLLSPLFPRSSTFPAAAPPPRQVPAPSLPPPPRPPKAYRWTRSPPPPPRLLRSSWSFAGVPGAQRLWMAEAQSGTGQLQEQKKGLLIAVSASVDKIISHFGAARNLVQKAQLGDSRLSPDVGHLVLTTLCPALHALVADGLKPFRKDLITGQRRSSPWSVVEASVKPGSSSSLGSLYSQVSRLAPLSSSRSRFHAFILGLLNTKQLELWFSSLQEDAGLLSLLYLPTGFFSLARGGCPSLSTELLLLLQPLSVLTFHLDLLFEHHHHLLLGQPQAPAPPGPPPALQQTVQAVLHWGGRLAQSLRGTSGEGAPNPSPPPSPPTPVSWWEQLTQASRVYASGGTEGFPLPRWGLRRQGTTAEGTQEGPLPAEEVAPGRSLWLGRLFGVPGVPTETENGALKSRRPSSWLPPTVSVLAFVKRGAPVETPSSEELVASAPSMAQAHRTVRALCDHTAAGPDQLSFQRGEVLRVIATVDEDWLRCGRDGTEGLVPVGYTSLVL